MEVYEIGKQEPTIHCEYCGEDKRESAGYFVFGESVNKQRVICADCVLEYVFEEYSEDMTSKHFRNIILEDLKSWR